mmetsp:Transcript_90159/g.232730  ORF Transcript_90159/g.232730 Transcript_90159/m.232730 type:complete len:406 (+) Transcript_90159:25-1242(+)
MQHLRAPKQLFTLEADAVEAAAGGAHCGTPAPSPECPSVVWKSLIEVLLDGPLNVAVGDREQLHRLLTGEVGNLPQASDAVPLDLEPGREQHEVVLVATRGHVEVYAVLVRAALRQVVEGAVAGARAARKAHLELVLDRCIQLLPLLGLVELLAQARRPAGLLAVWRCAACVLAHGLLPLGRHQRGILLRVLWGLPLCVCILPLGPLLLLLLAEPLGIALHRVVRHLLDQGVRCVPAQHGDVAFHFREGQRHAPLHVHVLLDQLPPSFELTLQGKPERKFLTVAIRERHAHDAEALLRRRRHDGHEVGVLEAEEERLAAALLGRALHGQVDAAEEDGRERLAEGVGMRGARQHDDGPAQRMSQREDVNRVQERVRATSDVDHVRPLPVQLLLRDLHASRLPFVLL